MSALGRNVLSAVGGHLRRNVRLVAGCSGRDPGAVQRSATALPRRYNSTSAGDRVMTSDPAVVQCPFGDVSIPDNVGLTQYVINRMTPYGDRTALVDGVSGQETSFSELVTSITRVASALAKSGIKKGDVVTLFSPNCPEFVITYLAVAAIGGVVSAVNPVYTAGELQHALSHAGARLLVTSPALLEVAKAAAKGCPDLTGIVVLGTGEGCRPFSDLLADNGGAFPDNMDFKPKEDMVALPYSSGTTGLPKGVMLSQYNIIANLEQIGTDKVLNFVPEDVLLGVLPFFHIYGMVVVMLSSLLAGSKLVILPRFDAEQYLGACTNYRSPNDKANLLCLLESLGTEHALHYSPDDCLVGVLPFFHIYGQVVVMLSGLIQGAKTCTMPSFDPAHYLGIVEKHRATFLHVVPPMLIFLSQHPMVDKYDLSSVQGFMSAAAPLAPHVMHQVMDRVATDRPVRAIQGYGMTEASPVTHCNPPTDYQYSSVGPPVHNTESKVVDLTTGETLGYGHEGEVLLRGPQVMLGYFKNEKATAETVTEDGWLRTGDIGYCQPDSHFHITDRLKELIKVKGFQVAPAELEALLLQNKSVQDVAVIGIPDERAGELPRAYVVLKPGQSATEDDIKDFVKDKVAPFKRLAGGVEFIEQVPKSASGKILRRELKVAFKSK